MSSTCFEPEGSSSGRRLYIIIIIIIIVVVYCNWVFTRWQ